MVSINIRRHHHGCRWSSDIGDGAVGSSLAWRPMSGTAKDTFVVSRAKLSLSTERQADRSLRTSARCRGRRGGNASEMLSLMGASAVRILHTLCSCFLPKGVTTRKGTVASNASGGFPGGASPIVLLKWKLA